MHMLLHFHHLIPPLNAETETGFLDHGGVSLSLSALNSSDQKVSPFLRQFLFRIIDGVFLWLYVNNIKGDLVLENHFPDEMIC